MTNPKIALFNYCRQMRAPIPKYESWMSNRMGRRSNYWLSRVHLHVNGIWYSGQSPTPVIGKGRAERLAADQVAQMLDICDKNNKNTQWKPIKEKSLKIFQKIDQPNVEFYDKIFLVDLENRPLFKSVLDSKALYIGFINTIHSTLPNYKSWYWAQSDCIHKEIELSRNHKLLYTIDGGTKDLVDHFMTYFASPLIEYVDKNSAKIYIVSADHSSWCTRACLERLIRQKELYNVTIINTIQI